MTFREIIQTAGELRPHSFSEQVLFRWLTSLDGKLAAAVFLMAPEEFRQRNYAYPEALGYEPLVEYPHQDMYVQYLIAQIDLALGENEQYQNDMAVYNESYGSFVRWFATRYAPGKGYESGCRCGCGPDGNPPYYLTAYGLAVQQGFQGSLEAWLRSLHGDSVELRVVNRILQWRRVSEVAEAEYAWEDLYDLGAYENPLQEAMRTLEQQMEDLNETVGDAAYQPIAVLSMGNSHPVNEIGSTISDVELFWVLNKAPQATTLDGAEAANDSEYAGTDNASYTADKTWTVLVEDERGARAQATTQAVFLNGVYYGVQSDPIEGEDEHDSAFVLSLEKRLQPDQNLVFSCDAIDIDDFVYVCVPERYGECAFTITGAECGFSLVEVIAFTNASGYTEPYRIYRSEQGGLGQVSVAVKPGSEGVAFDNGYVDDAGYLHLTLNGMEIEGFTPFRIGGGLAFNGGYTDAEGYLHLTLNGQDLPADVFTPFFVGTGGSGNAFGSQMKLTCELESRTFSIKDSDEDCLLPFFWSSVDSEDGSVTGSGSAAWFVNGSRVAVQKVPQGDCSFDIKDYLTNGEENEVVLTVSDSYGNSKKMTFIITVLSIGMTWNMAEMAYHQSNAVTLRLVPSGSGSKVVKVSVDGAEVLTATVTTSGRTVSTTVGPFAHGVHTILAWMETETDGETLSTEPLRHVGIWTEIGYEIPLVGVYEPKITVGQFGTVVVKYLAVDPSTEFVYIARNSSDGTSVVSADRTMQTWAYKANVGGTETLEIVCGAASAKVELTVTSPEHNISPVTAGLVFDVDPSGRSNEEVGRENFGYTDGAGVNHPFVYSEGFDWTRGGFRLDEDGVAVFVIPRGSCVTADCSLFADNAKVNGKEIKIIFRSENVRDYDAELLSCVYRNIGIRLQAQQATIGSEVETMTIPYCEGKKIEMDINIQAENEDSLAYVCLNAIPSAKPIQYGTSDSWTQSTPQMLTIGSKYADVWIYRIKMYGNSLSRHEILDNYIADCGSPKEMSERYLRNDIFNEDGSININKLTARNANLRAIHIRAKRMTTGKDDEVVADVEIMMESGGDAHHLTAQNAVFKAQGTSSLEYILAALNLDIDFSEATSWVNGAGEAITAYAFTENSIPVDYFNLKADVASSESANNVVLADDYNAYNPVPFAGKTGMVRDCIEGHPCAVFYTNTSDDTVSVGARTVEPGETILYFAGNMNNSKKNFEVFGWDSERWPEQCCVEILNNIDLQCRFRSDDLSKETWDGAEGTSSFEFAFPKNPTDAHKSRFMEVQAWLVSTATDLATGNALGTTTIYGNKAYANDTPEYREAKFLAEFDRYFVRDQILYHFLKTERHCMADNRAKNLFFCYDYYESVGGYRWSVRRNYDNDTAEGCDNSGGATFSYGLELNDMIGDSYVFNANDSTLWVNVDKLMQGDLLRVYKSNKDAWDAKRILKKYREYQAITPEALRVEDMWNKYFQPLLLAGEAAFLKRCHGTKEPWREQFETYQEVYMNSKYLDTSDRSNCISLRATVESSDAGNIVIVPYSDLYAAVMYGTNGIVKIRAKRNQRYTIECPTDSLTDTETYIFSASHLKELGSLASLKTKFVTLTKAEKLQILPIGSGDVGYQNLNMTELGLGNNTLMEYLDVRGLPNLKGAMDLSSLTSLEEFYGNGSGITSITFAKGAPLRIARMPELTSFTARDLTQLETFVMDGTKLQSILVENCPTIDTLALCKSATELIRGRLVDVNWTDDNADVLTRLSKLQANGGFDANGKIIDGFVLTGKAYCNVITQLEIDTITAAFPDLELTYGSIVSSYTVTFCDWDGTVFPGATQIVRHGAAAVNPVSASIIPAPTREPSLYEVYTYAGWDKSFLNVTSDLLITAVYSGAMRYFTVNFWLDAAESTLLDTQSVPTMGSATYSGVEPTKTGGVIWSGWDQSFAVIQSDMNIHAVWVEPVLPDVAAAGYDYLYSDNPADKCGYTADEFWGILYHGKERDFFSLGDRVKMVCSTSKFTDTEIILELRSFKHFESAERAGFAGPYFGMVGIMNQYLPYGVGNTGGFAASKMFTVLNETYHPGLPLFWRNIIEKIRVLSSAGGQNTGIATGETFLTLESLAELGFSVATIPYCNEIASGADEITFSCYTDNVSRVKKTHAGNSSYYFLRSPIPTSDSAFVAINNDGSNGAGFVQSGIIEYHRYALVSFGFCIRNNLAPSEEGTT